MKKSNIKQLIILILASFALIQNCFALYETNIAKGSNWLSSQQNIGGSWGSSANHKYLNTLTATNALYSIGLRNSNYYKGITWLQNHGADNIDFQSRRFLQLSEYGNDLANDIVNKLVKAQNIAVSGRIGWGLSEKYLQSPLDTAIVLSSINNFSTPATVNKEAAKNYLKSVKQVNNSWTMNNSTVSDPVTTAYVVAALSEFRSSDASLAVILNSSVEYLKSTVPQLAPISLQALSAQAALSIGNSDTANIWISSIISKQDQNGSWNNSIYDTALALKVLAKAGGFNFKEDRKLVSIPDDNLRKVINLTLGRNSLDSLSKNEIALLKVLNARNSGVKNLSGLEWAKNLETIDLRGNPIASTEPISKLSKLKNIILIDNTPADEDIPFLPLWAMMIMAVGILVKNLKQNRKFK